MTPLLGKYENETGCKRNKLKSTHSFKKIKFGGVSKHCLRKTIAKVHLLEPKASSTPSR